MRERGGERGREREREKCERECVCVFFQGQIVRLEVGIKVGIKVTNV